MVHCVAVAGIEICVGVDAIHGLFRWAVNKRLFEITLICVSECGNTRLGFQISKMFVRVRLCFFCGALVFLEMFVQVWLCFSGGHFFFRSQKWFVRAHLCFLEGACFFSDIANVFLA